MQIFRTRIRRPIIDWIDNFYWAIRSDSTSKWSVYKKEGPVKSWNQADARQFPHDLPNVVDQSFVTEWTECGSAIGVCHPRIWRGHPSPGRKDYVREWSSSYGAVSSIVSRMGAILRYIEPTAANRPAYGHEIRQLLLLAAMEVESSWRAVLKANHYPGALASNTRLTTNDYVQLLIPMRLNEWSVTLSIYPDFGALQPFAQWSKGNPTASLPWYDAYNATKHDRDANFARATLQNAVTAVAGAYILVLAQFGEFDARQDFGLDEFTRETEPEFPPAEAYVPPIKSIVESWNQVPLFLS
jgi:hypothetical protein